MATAWLIASKSRASVESLINWFSCPFSELMEKWNADGMRTAMTAINSRDELSWAAVLLIVCSWNRTPPAKKHMPSTSRMLLRIEPTKDDCTTASSHCGISRCPRMRMDGLP